MSGDAWKAAAKHWLEAALANVDTDTEAVAEAEAALMCCRILAGEAEPDPDLLVSDEDEDCTCPPDLLARGGFSSGCPAHSRLRTDGAR